MYPSIFKLCILAALFSMSCSSEESSSESKKSAITTSSSAAETSTIENSTTEILTQKKTKPQKEKYAALEELMKNFDKDAPPSDEDLAQLVKELGKMGKQLPEANRERGTPDLTNRDVLVNLIAGDGGSQADAFEEAMTNGVLPVPDDLKPMFEEILKQRKIEEGRRKKMSKEEQNILAEMPHNNLHQIHNEEEAKAMLASMEKFDLKEMMKDTSISKEFKKQLSFAKKNVRKANEVLKKSKRAKKNFNKQNPDSNFGEEAGRTFMSDQGKAVYLPLGDASFADEIINYKQQDDLQFPMERCLGAPDYIKTRNLDHTGGVANIGLEGQLTVKFTNNALVNVAGPDLFVFEIGKIEPTRLEISKDGSNWIDVGKIKGGTAEVDIANFVEDNEPYYYVRLTDLKTRSSVPGADIDAIAAIGAAMLLQLSSEVLFDFGKSTLKEEGIEAIAELSKQLFDIKEANIIIEGHTDNVGSETSNKKLSLARAKSVSSELEKHFDSNYKFKYIEKGAGESSPIAPNDTDENRQLNRRVEILVIPK